MLCFMRRRCFLSAVILSIFFSEAILALYDVIAALYLSMVAFSAFLVCRSALLLRRMVTSTALRRRVAVSSFHFNLSTLLVSLATMRLTLRTYALELYHLFRATCCFSEPQFLYLTASEAFCQAGINLGTKPA